MKYNVTKIRVPNEYLFVNNINQRKIIIWLFECDNSTQMCIQSNSKFFCKDTKLFIVIVIQRSGKTIIGTNWLGLPSFPLGCATDEFPCQYKDVTVLKRKFDKYFYSIVAEHFAKFHFSQRSVFANDFGTVVRVFYRQFVVWYLSRIATHTSALDSLSGGFLNSP